MILLAFGSFSTMFPFPALKEEPKLSSGKPFAFLALIFSVSSFENPESLLKLNAVLSAMSSSNSCVVPVAPGELPAENPEAFKSKEAPSCLSSSIDTTLFSLSYLPNLFCRL